MMRTALIWTLALGVSVAAHGAGAYAVYLATRPGDIPEQPIPETQLELAAYQVQRSTARETTPDSDQALAGDTSGSALGQGQIATSRATAIEADATETAALATQGDRLAAEAPEGSQAAIVDNTAQSISPVAAPQTNAAPAVPTTEVATPATLAAQNLEAVSLPAEATSTAAVLPVTDLDSAQVVSVTPATPAALPLSTTPAILAEPAVFRTEQTALTAPVAQSLSAQNEIAQEASPELTTVAQRPMERETAAPVAPKADWAKAALAFAGTGDGTVDPVSLSAFQSFMEPGDLSGAAAEVRDGISGILSAVPCSRLQVEFDPTDNTLVVAGHVPETELRSSVVAAMQAQMGTDIPVRDNLLILPRPQCGALSGIASVGLPQSTDQITNPLLVGESTHAREFRYAAGNPLVMTLQGADYDAFVYVDYFDADGNVLHLMPNQFTPLVQTPAEAALQIGADGPLAAGEPGLYIEIGPPFGQEIAVAFASSVPLYDGVRPLVEPAAPYLEWLRTKVSEARARDPNFKGEWVYFFVTTAAE